jgi:hypothetical protein
MHPGNCSVYEIMLKMRAIAFSWTEGDLERADALVARTLEIAIDGVNSADRHDVEKWLLGLLETENGWRTPVAPSAATSSVVETVALPKRRLFDR